MNDSSEERAVKNEQFFAETNALIVDDAVSGNQRVDVICECARAGCVHRVPMTAEEYEHAHRDPSHFVVSPGHQIPDIERVVLREKEYVIVEKFALAA